MSILQLADAKQHLQVDHDDDDALLQGFLDAAEKLVETYLRRDLAVDFPTGLPAPMRVAVLALVARLEADREAFDAGGLPDMVKVLLAEYRVFDG